MPPKAIANTEARAGFRLNIPAGPMAPLIAIIGADGAGKTTTAHYLCSALQNAHYAYLGLGSGAIGLKIRAWPIIGPLLEKRLSNKARQARTPGQQIPGPVTALVIYLFGRLRLRRFKQMLRMRARGYPIICDRYPQVQIPGLNDGPGLGAALPKGWFTRWLAEREHQLYVAMADVQPTLVIRLTIDAQTAWQRKPDHDLRLIQKKVEATAALQFPDSQLVEIDARAPEDEVRATCLRLVQLLLAGGPVRASTANS